MPLANLNDRRCPYLRQLNLGFSSPEKGRLTGTSFQLASTNEEVMENTCTAVHDGRTKTIGGRCKKRGSFRTERQYFSPESQPSAGTAHPEMLGSLCPWGFSNSERIKPSIAWSAPVFVRLDCRLTEVSSNRSPLLIL